MSTYTVNVFFFCFLGYIYFVDSFYVVLTHNGPIVHGATITFRAELFNEHGGVPTGTFRFIWNDNAIPEHFSGEDEFEGHETVSVWNVTYPADVYGPGMYEVQVNVEKSALIYWPLTSQRAYFNLTALLNGHITVDQGNVTRELFVSNKQEVRHSVWLKETDSRFIKTNATSILTFWFVDCVYYGQSSDYQFRMNYSEPLKEHNIEALVVASYEPLVTTTVAPSTTPASNVTTTTVAPASNVTTPPTTTTPSTTTTTTTTTTAKPVAEGQLTTTLPANSTEEPTANNTFMVPFVCLNTSLIPPDPKKTYGYFHKKIQVKAPISKVAVEGTNWLKHGDILNLVVTWEGSPDYTFCLQVYYGIYNVSGKEDCGTSKNPVVNNTLNVKHYFAIPGTYTYVIILQNDVSKNVTQVAINVYEVTKQAQLSVTVVPVACSLLAVILIVFGVAYYIQSRNTYTVEVADFNFGQRDNMEYKTFRERLREAFQGNGFSCPEVGKPGDAWGPGGSRSDYGRMN